MLDREANNTAYNRDGSHDSHIHLAQIYARAACLETVSPEQLNEEMSFQSFFQMIDFIISKTGKTLKDVYPKCPQVVHAFFPLGVAQKKYNEFLGGKFIEGEISSKVSAPILHALSLADAPEAIEKTVPGSVETSRVKRKKIPIEEFKGVFNLLRKSKDIPLKKIWKLLPADIQGLYSYATIREYLKPNHTTERAILSEFSQAVIDAYQKFPDRRKIVDVTKFNARKIPIEEFRGACNLLRESKKVSLKKVWQLTPTDIQERYSCGTVINYLNPNHNKARNVSLEVSQAVTDAYQKFPDWDQPVSSDEILDSFLYKDGMGLMVSAKVAYDQIKHAQDKYQVKQLGFTRVFSERVGIDIMVAQKLFRTPKTERSSCSRLSIAMVLAVIEGKSISQPTIELYHRSMQGITEPF